MTYTVLNGYSTLVSTCTWRRAPRRRPPPTRPPPCSGPQARVGPEQRRARRVPRAAHRVGCRVAHARERLRAQLDGRAPARRVRGASPARLLMAAQKGLGRARAQRLRELLACSREKNQPTRERGERAVSARASRAGRPRRRSAGHRAPNSAPAAAPPRSFCRTAARTSAPRSRSHSACRSTAASAAASIVAAAAAPRAASA